MPKRLVFSTPDHMLVTGALYQELWMMGKWPSEVEEGRWEPAISVQPFPCLSEFDPC